MSDREPRCRGVKGVVTMGYNPENLEKGNKSEQKPRPKPDPKAVGGTVLKGLGVKRPGK